MNRLVYLISPNRIYKNFYNDLKDVLSSKKVKFFQLRMKKIDKRNILQISKKIKPITKKYNVKFIITENLMLENDSIIFHIGQLDGSMNEVKKHLKNKIFGCFPNAEKRK